MIESIVSALVGMVCGNIMMFLLYPQKKKSEELKNAAQDIENEATQSEEWQKLYNEVREQNSALNTKVDSLYGELSNVRTENSSLYEQLTEYKIDNTRLKLLKCEKPACPHRQPPTGY